MVWVLLKLKQFFQDVDNMVNGFKTLLHETCDVEKGEEAGRIYKLSSKKALEKDPKCMYTDTNRSQ